MLSSTWRDLLRVYGLAKNSDKNQGSERSPNSLLEAAGNIKNSNPLILVDGVEGILVQINPNDIEISLC